MNKEKKLNKQTKLTIVIIILIILLMIGIKVYNTIEYHKTDEYKLITIGYKEKEWKKILESDSKTIEYAKNHEYDKQIIELLDQKYYLSDNLEKYINYMKENKDKNLDDVIAIINTSANNEWYSNTTKTDIDKDILLLSNKFHYLDENYEPDDLVNIKNWYAYGDTERIRDEVLNAYLSMYDQAVKNNIKFIINSSFRSYQEQQETYDDYEATYGKEYADGIAARPGFSEHQTGLALDIISPGTKGDEFDQTDTFKWLQNNAYKYGFILRYPKDKEYITGYRYESWHYRYVGIDVAKYIHDNNITFDEYYAYFIDGGKNEKEKKK